MTRVLEERRRMLAAVLALVPALVPALALAQAEVAAPGPATAPATTAPTAASRPGATAPSPDGLAGSAGEQMDFSIEYLDLAMGKARISVGKPAGALVPVFLLAETGGIASFLTVRQQIASALDLATGLPRTSRLEALEPGGYHHTDTARFDREAGTATVREVGKYDKTYEVAVPRDAVDFMAMVFRLRAMPLEPGQHHEFQVLSGRKVSPITVEVMGRETVVTDAGRFTALKVRVPTGFDGKFKEKNPTFLWLSDDARRIVVRISTDFAIGRADARLVAYRPGHAEG